MGNKRYDSSISPFDITELKLLYISRSKYEGDWYSTMHAHQCTELFYVVAGRGEFCIEEVRFPVSANDIVIINSNIQHTETALLQNPMEYIVLGIEGGDFLMQESADKRYCVMPCGSMGGNILDCLNEILQELARRDSHFDLLAQNLLENMLIRLLRHMSISLQKHTSPKSGSDLANVKHYIDRYFKENITLDMLAEFAHLNKYYLVHAFKKEYDVSPINYLIQMRIEESRYFLSRTNHSISQISQMLGFSSPSYFSQCFARYEKRSPREFRKQAQQSDLGDAQKNRPRDELEQAGEEYVKISLSLDKL